MVIMAHDPACAVCPSSLRLKIDPGSKYTGLAILDENCVIWAAEIKHRQMAILMKLLKRNSLRRSRRGRKTRYRKPSNPVNKKNHRKRSFGRPNGWIPPSLKSRVLNTVTWVQRIMQFAPIGHISIEINRFDTQRIENPEIIGMEYQQGELMGYEQREYLLEKWGRACVYCGKENVPLQIEHIIPRSLGGTNRISNLTLACQRCNQKKGARTASDFGFPKIEAKAKKPLRDAANMNTTRYAIRDEILQLGLPVEMGTGGQTKWNRLRRGLNKQHWIDAACVGMSTPDHLYFKLTRILKITAKGHGQRQRVTTDKYGFPKSHKRRKKVFSGFKTGDIAKAKAGKIVGTSGRISINSDRAAVMLVDGKRKSIQLANLEMVHASDGYDYEYRPVGDVTSQAIKARAS